MILFGETITHTSFFKTLNVTMIILGFFGTGENPGFNAQERTNKTLTIGPFGNTCEADEVSPKVEAGVVARLRCLQP
jgi:hypothetical protein